ncbi:MAG: isovaleryl-CoA dehydrogenase [Polyangia bacterium]
MTLAEQFVTHTVENQATPLVPYDAYATDAPLIEALCREGAAWAAPDVGKLGPVAGGELAMLGFLANENKPKLRTFDSRGNRIDEVEFHPAYHRIMELGIEHGVPSYAWKNADTAGAHVARAALMYLYGQPEQGCCCPLTMTYASVPALRHQPELAEQWLPRITSTEYDARFIPAWDKRGNTIGMGMTEKQGGSDVRANTTRAQPLGKSGPGALYELVGHKWFMSAPMCDAFLVLAKAEGGLSCFLLPRFTPEGTLNAIRIQRLKDKLGNWSNASSEVEFLGAQAWLIGEEGRGVPTILEMVSLTRQDCIIGSSAIMRQALVQAIHHTRTRKAFGRTLAEQPLMQNVLADLALESEAHVALMMRVARAVDGSAREPKEAAFARIATAIGKYWVCKRCVPFVNEAQECLGGIGYVEESILPRLLREAPLNSIWEGSGNIQCLDVLRAMAREPESRNAFFDELALTRGAHASYDAGVRELESMLSDVSTLELRSRHVVEKMALLLQSSLLLRANSELGEVFSDSRLGGSHGAMYGTLPPSAPRKKLLERALPE